MPNLLENRQRERFLHTRLLQEELGRLTVCQREVHTLIAWKKVLILS